VHCVGVYHLVNSNIKFHKNPSSGSRIVRCGQADMKKLTVAFRSFPNAPKKTGLHCIQDESVGINTVGL